MTKRTFPELIVPDGQWGKLARSRLHEWCRRAQQQFMLEDQQIVELNETTTTIQNDITNIYNSLDGTGNKVIWEWNGTDTSQLGAAETFTFDITAAAGSAAWSVTSVFGQNALTCTLTNFQGAIVFPFVGVDLPDRFAVELEVVGRSATTADAFFMMSYQNASSALDGFLSYRSFGTTTHNLYFVIGDTCSVATSLSYSMGLTLTATNVNDGPTPFRWEYKRQNGANPHSWYIRAIETGNLGSNTSRAVTRASTTSSALPAGITGFNGLNFDSLGIGFVRNAGAITGTASFQNIRVIDLT